MTPKIELPPDDETARRIEALIEAVWPNRENHPGVLAGLDIARTLGCAETAFLAGIELGARITALKLSQYSPPGNKAG
jgi:NaMN:DMB phosphoribosyltransferase